MKTLLTQLTQSIENEAQVIYQSNLFQMHIKVYINLSMNIKLKFLCQILEMFVTHLLYTIYLKLLFLFVLHHVQVILILKRFKLHIAVIWTDEDILHCT